ncbi:MAG: T9SS type A sorting domain-containing protein [Bacteroidetes bacterium]|nr:T9SS type A sorting domain-containing protein [Bacteroidota bacterium]
MKKQLLLGSALLAAITAFPQDAAKVNKPIGTVNLPARLHQKHLMENNLKEAPATNLNPSTAPSQAKTASAAISKGGWSIIGGSRNAYGMLVSGSKPLQYNAALNAVSFVHRVSGTYAPQPANNSGGIMMDYSTNWFSAPWDSTCLWSDGTNLARYPQGGIYNPIGNTNINAAYGVATGPATGGSGWLGSWFASKPLGGSNNNNTASSVPNAMQFQNNTAPFNIPSVGKVDFTRYGFTSSSNGIIRTAGYITADINGTTNNAYGLRGINLVKGTFNSGTFTWTGDSLLFAGLVHTSGTLLTPADPTDDYLMAQAQPVMAWNEAGTVGYAAVIAVRATPSSSANSGYQPLIWKTTTSGASWALVPAIDFAASTFSTVLKRLDGVQTNTTVKIPQFNATEGITGVVDANDKFHFISTIVSTGSAHPDSVYASYSYTLSTSTGTIDSYSWPHETPGKRAYIYDFMTDGATWTYQTIDTLTSEDASTTSGNPGYNQNPWSAAAKLGCDARIQASRTADGKYVAISWAESNPNFAQPGNHSYNAAPELKVRLMDITGTGGMGTYKLSPTKINASNLTASGSGQPNPAISGKSVLHYMAPVSGSMSVGSDASKSSTLTIPFTVSHIDNLTAPYEAAPATGTNIAHWFCAAQLDFKLTVVGINENELAVVNNAVLYPNPTSANANLSIDLKDNSVVSIQVYNVVGQLVASQKANGQIGENNITIGLNNLTTGIYMVNVKVGGVSATKKLIVE